MTAEDQIRCVADVHAVLGEGPIWVARDTALYWLDVKGRKIFRLNADGKLDQWPTPFRVGSIAPRKSGGFIAGTDQGIAEIDLDAGRFEVILTPEKDKPRNRFNDGKVDRSGRFWPGTMDDREEQASGALYRLDAILDLTQIGDGYNVPNGPAFSPDGSLMYLNDSARRVTYAFDLDERGDAHDRRTFLQYGEDEGHPDGMTVDREGCLWVAFWDGWCVRRFSPDGGLLQKLELPVSRPTSCAFGGPDLDRLYITSASIDLDDSQLNLQPNAGGLFMVTAGVQGLDEAPFAG